jgi:hypothetical protein
MVANPLQVARSRVARDEVDLGTYARTLSKKRPEELTAGEKRALIVKREMVAEARRLLALREEEHARGSDDADSSDPDGSLAASA